jgi:hypothetical protein
MKRYQASFALTEFLLVILFVLSLTLLSGCEMRIETRNVKQDVEQIKHELSYFKDEYGNCFASIGSMGSHGFVITSITSIPCERMP